MFWKAVPEPGSVGDEAVFGGSAKIRSVQDQDAPCSHLKFGDTCFTCFKSY